MTSTDDPKLLVNLWAKEGKAHSVDKPYCACLRKSMHGFDWRDLPLHREEQDTSLPAWHRVQQFVDDAIADQRQELSFAHIMAPEDWAQIVTLPASIARLRHVKHLNLYGSSLVRIPPEIGRMESLEVFTPYTSRRLHWFPYEITRCSKLRESTISTRSIYGNFKHRPPFPRLPVDFKEIRPKTCSVCDGDFRTNEVHQVWISLGIATDVLPLLVHACSKACIESLPSAAKGHVSQAHQGGVEVEQPEPGAKSIRWVQDKIEAAKNEFSGTKFQERLNWLMHWNSSSNRVFDLLLAAGLKVRQSSGLLARSCCGRNLVLTERLIALGADVNEVDEEENTPLMSAAGSGFLSGVKLLLKHGANKSVAALDRDAPKNTARWFAIEGLEDWKLENGGYLPDDVKFEYESIIELLD